MFFFDTNYLLLAIVTLVISLGAQMYVRSAYSRWGKVRNSAGLTGVQVAERIFRDTNVSTLRLEGTPGQLTDHFDPGNNVVRMSEDTATVPSVASMAITAHELGHVQQYQENSALIQMRSFLVPAVRFSPQVAYALIFAGFIFGVTGLIWLGILFFGVMVAFMLLTLPVELDASRRGLKLLEESGLMQAEADSQGARQVLNAAAMTYLAAAVSAVLTLLYYISLANRR